MKKTILCAAAAAILFSSCVGSAMVWDPALPEEEMAPVIFWGAYPTSYNGVSVPTRGTTHIKFPEGKADFVCNVAATSGSAYYIANDQEWSYTFMKGRKYMLSFAISKGLPGFNVYGGPVEESVSMNKEYFIEFVPFRTTDLSK
jgi:hypothetical protein